MTQPTGSRPAAARRRRPGWFLGLMALLVLLPLAELYLIIQVGHVIGGWQTIALLLVEGAIGAWIVKREGRSTWTAFTQALRTGRMPATELTDAALVLVGGALLLSPGFITDVFGFFLILPATRPLVRRRFAAIVERRLLARTGIVRGSVIP